MMLQKNTKKYNPKKSQITDHSHRVLMNRSSGFGKTNLLIDLKILDQILIKFIYMLKIQLKQNTNF